MPRSYTKPVMRRLTSIALSQREIDFARQLGNGNLSKGVRRALSTASEYLTARGAEAIAAPEESVPEQSEFD